MEYFTDNGKKVYVKMFLTIFIRNKSEGKIGNEKVEWIATDEVKHKLSYGNLQGYFSSVMSEIKNTGLDGDGVAIIISRGEPFVAGAELIAKEANERGLGCEIIFIEDIILSINGENEKMERRLLYFLTNIDDVPTYVAYFKSHGCNIVNQTFLSGESSKFYLQNKIKKAGIVVPKSFSVLNEIIALQIADEMNFPIYIKSQNQASTVIRVKKKSDLSEKLALFARNNEEWYLEEAIEGADVELQKVYYVDGKVASNSGIEKANEIFQTISRTLDLEIFSVDIISSKNGVYWIIDVNPASSFFKSDSARCLFVEFLIQKLARINRAA